MSSELIISYFSWSSVRYQLPTLNLPRGKKVLKSHRWEDGCYSGDGESWGVGCANHRNVEQYMLALAKESLMHSVTFEMSGLMVFLQACVTKCLPRVKNTVWGENRLIGQ